MNSKFSKRSDTIQASEIRELLKLIGASDIISFGGGLPAEEIFPVEEMKVICGEILSEYGGKSMQYAPSEGYDKLRKIIVEIMREKGINADLDNILIVSGSQQGLDLTAKAFIDEGDTIICESPTYLSAINAFKPFYPKFEEICIDNEGLIPEALEERLKNNKNVKFLYTIPDFQNPTGVTLSLERRKKIIELANKYNILIVEDNPYSELNFTGQYLPSLKSLDTEERVIYLSTFSKTVCPGFRIGWICASKEIIKKYVLFRQGSDLHTNIFSQMQIAKLFEKYDVKANIKKNIEICKSRRDTMLDTIKAEFPKEVKYTEPKGGFFLWVTLPAYMDSKELLKCTLKSGVAFISGEAFFPNGGHKNTLRLNYSSINEEKIRKGIKILSNVIKENML
ncbi:PLP-dependent aminotransferase family protein [Bacillus salipaludis]|uniref:PLP-dependent aminotransferase family protein n=1 Tax=Bacillus salipaludis TaxID=2547811 RepID=A0ABW8RP98_9BACI